MQLPAAVVMVRPASFGFNPDTAPSFMFQREITDANRKEIERRARIEFDLLAGRLREAGADVIIVDDKEELNTPDAVFPNNWVSFHHDGTVVLYPMLAPSRRPERRRDIIDKLQSVGFRVSRVIDLTHHENDNRFLEGTGSVVFDHADHIAYANISPRTNSDVLNELSTTLGYQPVTFHATYENGEPIFHTDMVMSIGDRFVVFCGESIPDADERKHRSQTSRAIHGERSPGANEKQSKCTRHFDRSLPGTAIRSTRRDREVCASGGIAVACFRRNWPRQCPLHDGGCPFAPSVGILLAANYSCDITP
jgi:hypothetical protein